MRKAPTEKIQLDENTNTYRYTFAGIQRVEELEKDHSRPQQNKHNPAFCLQGDQSNYENKDGGNVRIGS